MGVSRFRHSLIIACFVSVAHNFNKLQSGWFDYGYLVFAEFSPFVNCLFQKIKRSGDLPVIGKWEAYMFSNHSCFGAIEEEHFLEVTHLLRSVAKMNIAVSSKKISAQTVVVSWRLLWVPSFQLVPLVLLLGKAWAAFAPKISLEVMINQLFTFSDNC